MTNKYFLPDAEYLNKAEELFQNQKNKIQKLLRDSAIEHIGSTVIPGSITKGDVDANVRVNSEEEFKNAVKVLKGLYSINQPENWHDDYASFKDESGLPIDFGVQLTIIDSPRDHFVKLVEILKNRPDLLKLYNQIKQKYGNDRERYQRERSKFLTELLKS